MKPHILTMKAFGPFAKETTVDFDAMGNSIYLISGDTGSGKTTIFDGIIYALYGTASGAQRSALGAIRVGALDGQFTADELGLLAGILQKPVSTDHAAREKAMRDYLRIIRDEREKRRAGPEDPLRAAIEKYTNQNKDRDGGTTHGN